MKLGRVEDFCWFLSISFFFLQLNHLVSLENCQHVFLPKGTLPWETKIRTEDGLVRELRIRRGRGSQSTPLSGWRTSLR